MSCSICKENEGMVLVIRNAPVPEDSEPVQLWYPCPECLADDITRHKDTIKVLRLGLKYYRDALVEIRDTEVEKRAQPWRIRNQVKQMRTIARRVLS